MTVGTQPFDTADVARGPGGNLAGALAGILAIAPIAALYLMFPARNYTDAKDSISYALRIRDGEPLFHPNHLLYEPVNYLIHRAATALSGPVDPLRTMQLFSTACAIPLLYCVYLLVWRVRGDVLAGALAAAAVGFCFGVSCYAVSPDGYTPPLFFALLAVVLLDPGGGRGSLAVPPSRTMVVAAALVTAAAVLLHQMYVFFAIVTGGVILTCGAFGTLRERWRAFLLYGALSGAIVVVTYLVAYAAIGSRLPFLDWARGYAREGLYWGDPPSWTTPIRGAIGAVSAMLTMNALFAFDFLSDALIAAFPGKSLFEERFIATTAIPKPLAALLLAAMLGAAGAWLLAASRALATLRVRPAEMTAVDRILLVSTLTFAILVLIWEPSNREFWIQGYVFATIWIMRRIEIARTRNLQTLAVLVACLFAVNFIGGIRPISEARTDYWRMTNRVAIGRQEPPALVITSCSWLCERYLEYFAGAAAVVSPAREDPEALRALIAAAGSGTVLVSSWSYHPHPSFAMPQGGPERIAAFREAFPEPDGSAVGQTPAARFYVLDGTVLVPVADEGSVLQNGR